ncbi:MAG: hypothetical protein CMN30_03405 [Sandaracinus sp.]|nr:hypothetical protein [Sandaracinus sp.]
MGLALFVGLTAVPLAQAQETEAEQTAAARSLFREGNRFLRQERWAAAADRFERALALRESPQIAYNLASALAETGQLVRATEMLRAIEADGEAPRQVREAATLRREAIEPRLASIAVRVDGDRTDVELTMDGSPLAWAMVDVSVPTDPGTHTVRAERSGALLDEAQTDVAEGGAAEVRLELPAAPPTPAETARAADVADPAGPAGPTDEAATKPRRWWFGVVVGVVAVGLAVGLGVGLTRDRSPECIQGTGGCLEIGGGS